MEQSSEVTSPPEDSSSEDEVILVVDDDEHISVAVKAFLGGKGYKIATAKDGQAGLIKAKAFRPNLVILDVMMPIMDGWTLIKHIRITPELAFIPVIFLTALGTADDRLKGFQLGADDFLPKPFNFGELESKVRHALDHAKAQIQNLESEMQNLSKDDYVFKGQLKDFSLCSLLTMSKIESHSGVLVLLSPQQDTGYLNIRDGEVISAKTEGSVVLENEEAMYHMVSWGEGSFEFQKSNMEDVEQEIYMNTDIILMEAVRRIDEGIT